MIQKWYATFHHLKMIQTPNLGFLPQIISEIWSISPILFEVGHDYSRNEVRGQGDPKMVCDPPPSQDACTHHFVMPTSNNIGYALYTIILEKRSEVKVTVTLKWYSTLCHPKMHPHTKFGIPISNNYSRNEVNKVKVTQKCYATFSHPKMHPQTKFWISTSNNVGDMLWI